MTLLRRAGWQFEGSSALKAAKGHLGIIQRKKCLEVGHQVGVDALQRLQQRNSHQLCKRLLELGPLLVEVKTPGQSQRSRPRSQRDHTNPKYMFNQDRHVISGGHTKTRCISRGTVYNRCDNKPDYITKIKYDPSSTALTLRY